MSVSLNRRLVLEAQERLPDGAGGFHRGWQERGVLWAEVRPGTGREQGADFLTFATVPWRITVRAAPEGAPSRPRPGERFRDGGRVFRILAVAERDAAAVYLICFCHEEVAQ